jgi:DNA-binding transcriptional regulator of glucitol operon
MVGMVWLGFWQWERSGRGSGRSLAYAFQWWVFAGFAVFMWVRMVREELLPSEPPADSAPLAAGPVPGAWQSTPGALDDEPEDAELAAYNRYLAELHARDQERA